MRALAAAALAHTVLFAAFTVGMGIVSAVAPLAAQAYGAREPRMVRRALRVGLWAAFMLGIPVTLVQFWGTDILIALGQAPESAALAGRYLAGMAWAILPAWIFIALRNFMGAVNRPEPALWITLVAIPINAALAYALIYGSFGLPALDLLGAGLATALVNVGMCAAAIWIAYTRHPFKKYRVLGRFWRPDWPLLAKLVAIGLPISGALLLEYGLFAAAALLMGRISTSAVAAHQIALQIAAILYMVPFGIATAATVRVGHAVGRRDAVGTRRAGFAALALGVAFMCVMTLVVALTRHVIPHLFLGAEAPQSGETDCARRHAAGAGGELLHHRWRPDRCRRRAAGPQRHARAAPVLGPELLGRRLPEQPVARLPGGSRRGRRVDRPVARHRGLCGAAGVALPSADRARLSARRCRTRSVGRAVVIPVLVTGIHGASCAGAS